MRDAAELQKIQELQGAVDEIKEITDAIKMGSEENFVEIMHAGKEYFEDAED